MQLFMQMALQCSLRNGRKLHSVTELMFALGIGVFLSATLHQFTINLGLEIREVGFGGQIWMACFLTLWSHFTCKPVVLKD